MSVKRNNYDISGASLMHYKVAASLAMNIPTCLLKETNNLSWLEDWQALAHLTVTLTMSLSGMGMPSSPALSNQSEIASAIFLKASSLVEP